MLIRWLMFGAIPASLAVVANAQPGSPNGDPRPQGAPPAAALIVSAGAETVAEDEVLIEEEPAEAEASTEAPAQANPKPRRAARVTSCRCGDSGQ